MLKIHRSLQGKRGKNVIQHIKAIPAYTWNTHLFNCEHGFMTRLSSIMDIDCLQSLGYLKPLQHSEKSRRVGCYLTQYKMSVCKPSSVTAGAEEVFFTGNNFSHQQ